LEHTPPEGPGQQPSPPPTAYHTAGDAWERSEEEGESPAGEHDTLHSESDGEGSDKPMVTFWMGEDAVQQASRGQLVFPAEAVLGLIQCLTLRQVQQCIEGNQMLGEQWLRSKIVVSMQALPAMQELFATFQIADIRLSELVELAEWVVHMHTPEGLTPQEAELGSAHLVDDHGWPSLEAARRVQLLAATSGVALPTRAESEERGAGWLRRAGAHAGGVAPALAAAPVPAPAPAPSSAQIPAYALQAAEQKIALLTAQLVEATKAGPPVPLLPALAAVHVNPDVPVEYWPTAPKATDGRVVIFEAWGPSKMDVPGVALFVRFIVDPTAPRVGRDGQKIGEVRKPTGKLPIVWNERAGPEGAKFCSQLFDWSM
jgi:hypothetical protein